MNGGFQMKKVKFIHCADIHLDAPLTLLGKHDKSSIRRDDIRQTFTRIIDLAIERGVDLLLISGDLYEHKFSKKSTIDFINRQFARIPGVRVVITPGNHDPDASNSFYNTVKWSGNVQILRTSKDFAYYDDIDTYVFCAGYVNSEKDMDELVSRACGTSFNILLFHGSVDMPFSNAYNAVAGKVLGRPEFDYIAAGHLHSIVSGAGPHGNIYNPGCPEPLAFDQTGHHGVFAGEIIHDGTKRLEVEFVKLNRKYYENLELDVSGKSFDEIISAIDEKLAPYETQNGLFNVTLKGYVDKDNPVDTALLKEHFDEKVFYMQINNETIPDFDFEEMVADPGLTGVFVGKLLEKIKTAANDEEREIYTKALYYGVEALTKGEVTPYAY